jgi:hypothetical protein
VTAAPPSVASAASPAGASAQGERWAALGLFGGARLDAPRLASLRASDAAAEEETVAWLRALRFEAGTPDAAYAAAERHFNETIREPVRIAITGQVAVGGEGRRSWRL